MSTARDREREKKQNSERSRIVRKKGNQNTKKVGEGTKTRGRKSVVVRVQGGKMGCLV